MNSLKAGTMFYSSLNLSYGICRSDGKFFSWESQGWWMLNDLAKVTHEFVAQLTVMLWSSHFSSLFYYSKTDSKVYPLILQYLHTLSLMAAFLFPSRFLCHLTTHDIVKIILYYPPPKYTGGTLPEARETNIHLLKHYKLITKFFNQFLNCC